MFGIMVLCIKFRVSWTVSIISFCFSHLIGKASGLLIGADYSCSEGEGEDDVVQRKWEERLELG